MSVEPLKATLGVPELSETLLRQALTHRSYSFENNNVPNNERLEFLGDAVLGVVVTATLYRNHPDLPEGQLAKLRAAVVSARALAEVARTIGLGEYLLLGKGEAATGGSDKPSILSDTLEAVIGAIFVEFGMPRAEDVISQLFNPVIAAAVELGAGLDWKTSLQELSAQQSLGVPIYEIEFTGPDHAREFTATVHIGERSFDGGTGRSKKEAEQEVAERAWRTLRAETHAGTS